MCVGEQKETHFQPLLCFSRTVCLTSAANNIFSVDVKRAPTFCFFFFFWLRREIIIFDKLRASSRSRILLTPILMTKKVACFFSAAASSSAWARKKVRPFRTRRGRLSYLRRISIFYTLFEYGRFCPYTRIIDIISRRSFLLHGPIYLNYNAQDVHKRRWGGFSGRSRICDTHEIIFAVTCIRA